MSGLENWSVDEHSTQLLSHALAQHIYVLHMLCVICQHVCIPVGLPGILCQYTAASQWNQLAAYWSIEICTASGICRTAAAAVVRAAAVVVVVVA